MDLQSPAYAATAQERAAEAPADARSDAAAVVDTADRDALARDSSRDAALARTGFRLGAIASDREVLKQGRLAFERGDDAAALEALSRLATHGVPFADVHYMIGMLRERRGEIDAALDSLQHAVRINPAYVEALLALASLHERNGDFDRSRGFAARASQLSRPAAGELDPTTRGKLANQQAALADALASAGERRDAIEQYRGALDRCPTFHDIRHRLAVTLREAGLPNQAAQEFRRIGRLQPSMLASQIQLGLTYYSMGRTPEAIAEWEAVLEQDPGRDEARMYLRLVRGTARRNAVADLKTRTAAPISTEDPLEPIAAVMAEAAAEAAEPAPEREISGWQTTALQPRSEDGTEDPAG